MKPRILIADDEMKMRRILEVILKDEGYEIDVGQDGNEAWRMFKQNRYDLVITDLKMPGTSGMELLGLINKENPEVPVIVITAYGSIQSAVQAMKAGAYDYITKPFENEAIKINVAKALAYFNLKYENRNLRKAMGATYNYKDFIGDSPQIKNLRTLAAQVARTSSTVLIQAESGTGKELLVRLIHFNSSRASRPFIAFNCGAFPDTLVESELFGYEKGAFAGALKQKPGRFERAHTGTIFLDEVGDLSADAQTKILRVLEEKTYERLGGTCSIHIDVRIIAATNKDLRKMVDEGGFRDDLYFRLNVFPLSIPPLREHKEDIPLLVEHFLRYFSRQMGKQVKEVSEEALNLLFSHPWRGNVRELRNCLERSVILCESHVITPQNLLITHALPDQHLDILNITIPPGGISLKEVETNLIKEALRMARGNQSKAADLLKITRNTLRYRLEKLKLTLDSSA
ncbi:MAG: sigma-54-dependent transcriptional regulator [bacterium]